MHDSGGCYKRLGKATATPHDVQAQQWRHGSDDAAKAMPQQRQQQATRPTWQGGSRHGLWQRRRAWTAAATLGGGVQQLWHSEQRGGGI
ncbi:Os04g0332301 [Oryza sativa Japonica Group]|jgi:hypothetical protein|uniref:Os04g0332301 protein n=1 Tax=Oryza sativa subsp. japonica TaxID=39947 RepID=A0A0P0W8T0_ORYSJ|nr:Os04g0332301 [Oryza sativa Japonica Group]